MCAAENPTCAAGAEAEQRRSVPRIVGTIAPALAALGFVLPLATPAQAQSPLIQGWLAANADCKGGRADEPKTQKACDTRDRLGGALTRRGCIFHQDGDWWKCPPR